MRHCAVIDTAVQPLRNMCQSPKPKSGNGLGWSNQTPSGGGITMRTDGGPENGPCAQVSVTQPGQLRIAFKAHSTPVNTGRKIFVGAMFYSNRSIPAMNIELNWLDAAGAGVGWVPYLAGPVGKGWQRLWIHVTPPTNAKQLGIAQFLTSGSENNVAAGDQFRVTEAMVCETEEIPVYADGDTPGWRWVGGQNISESTGTKVSIDSLAGRPAIYLDSRFVNGADQIFLDEFGRPNGAAGNGWIGKTWSGGTGPVPTIDTNQLYTTISGNADSYSYQTMPTNNYTVETDYVFNGFYSGLIVRAGVGNSVIWLRTDPTTPQWQILSRDSTGAGASYPVKTGMPTPVVGTTYRLKAICEGTSVKMYINNLLAYEVTVSGDLIAGRQVGIASYNGNSKFDNFEIRYRGIGNPPANPAHNTAIRHWRDLSGNSRDFVMIDSINRPVLKTSTANLLQRDEATCNAVTSGVNGYITTYWGSTLSLSTDVAPSVGNYVVKGLAGTNNQVFFAGSSWSTNAVPVVEGDRVHIRVRAQQGGSTTINGTLHTVFWTPAGTSMESGTQIVAMNPGQWHDFEVTGVVPAGYATAGFYININVGNQTTPAYLDKAQLTVGETINLPWEMPQFGSHRNPVVYFDGANKFMESNGLAFAGNEQSVYVVWSPNTIGPGTMGLTNMASTWHGFYTSAASSPRFFAGYRGTNTSPTTVPVDGSLHVQSTTFRGSIIDNAMDGGTIVQNSNASPIALDGKFRLGIDTGGNRDLLGGILAIVVYEQAHDDATRRRIEKFLGQTFGVALA